MCINRYCPDRKTVSLFRRKNESVIHSGVIFSLTAKDCAYVILGSLAVFSQAPSYIGLLRPKLRYDSYVANFKDNSSSSDEPPVTIVNRLFDRDEGLEIQHGSGDTRGWTVYGMKTSNEFSTYPDFGTSIDPDESTIFTGAHLLIACVESAGKYLGFFLFSAMFLGNLLTPAVEPVGNLCGYEEESGMTDAIQSMVSLHATDDLLENDTDSSTTCCSAAGDSSDSPVKKKRSRGRKYSSSKNSYYSTKEGTHNYGSQGPGSGVRTASALSLILTVWIRVIMNGLFMGVLMFVLATRMLPFGCGTYLWSLERPVDEGDIFSMGRTSSSQNLAGVNSLESLDSNDVNTVFDNGVGTAPNVVGTAPKFAEGTTPVVTRRPTGAFKREPFLDLGNGIEYSLSDLADIFTWKSFFKYELPDFLFNLIFLGINTVVVSLFVSTLCVLLAQILALKTKSEAKTRELLRGWISFSCTSLFFLLILFSPDGSKVSLACDSAMLAYKPNPQKTTAKPSSPHNTENSLLALGTALDDKSFYLSSESDFFSADPRYNNVGQIEIPKTVKDYTENKLVLNPTHDTLIWGVQVLCKALQGGTMTSWRLHASSKSKPWSCTDFLPEARVAKILLGFVASIFIPGFGFMRRYCVALASMGGGLLHVERYDKYPQAEDGDLDNLSSRGVSSLNSRATAYESGDLRLPTNNLSDEDSTNDNPYGYRAVVWGAERQINPFFNDDLTFLEWLNNWMFVDDGPDGMLVFCLDWLGSCIQLMMLTGILYILSVWQGGTTFTKAEGLKELKKVDNSKLKQQTTSDSPTDSSPTESDRSDEECKKLNFMVETDYSCEEGPDRGLGGRESQDQISSDLILTPRGDRIVDELNPGSSDSYFDYSTGEPYAISVSNITKVYELPDGQHEIANDDISFNVRKGEVFSLLGHNGAGKSTLIRQIMGVSPISYYGRNGKKSDIKINGISMRDEPLKARAYLGYCPQQSPIWEKMTVRQHLEIFGQCINTNKEDSSDSNGNADSSVTPAELLDLVPSDNPDSESICTKELTDWIEKIAQAVYLEDKLDTYAGHLSGGECRRMWICVALLKKSATIILLDEATTSLDPATRKFVWTRLKQLATEEGKTILFTTHYLEEADELSDRKMILAKGKSMACGTSQELKRQLLWNGYWLRLELREEIGLGSSETRKTAAQVARRIQATWNKIEREILEPLLLEKTGTKNVEKLEWKEPWESTPHHNMLNRNSKFKDNDSIIDRMFSKTRTGQSNKNLTNMSRLYCISWEKVSVLPELLRQVESDFTRTLSNDLILAIHEKTDEELSALPAHELLSRKGTRLHTTSLGDVLNAVAKLAENNDSETVASSNGRDSIKLNQQGQNSSDTMAQKERDQALARLSYFRTPKSVARWGEGTWALMMLRRAAYFRSADKLLVYGILGFQIPLLLMMRMCLAAAMLIVFTAAHHVEKQEIGTKIRHLMRVHGLGSKWRRSANEWTYTFVIFFPFILLPMLMGDWFRMKSDDAIVEQNEVQFPRTPYNTPIASSFLNQSNVERNSFLQFELSAADSHKHKHSTFFPKKPSTQSFLSVVFDRTPSPTPSTGKGTTTPPTSNGTFYANPQPAAGARRPFGAQRQGPGDPNLQQPNFLRFIPPSLTTKILYWSKTIFAELLFCVHYSCLLFVGTRNPLAMIVVYHVCQCNELYEIIFRRYFQTRQDKIFWWDSAKELMAEGSPFQNFLNSLEKEDEEGNLVKVKKCWNPFTSLVPHVRNWEFQKVDIRESHGENELDNNTEQIMNSTFLLDIEFATPDFKSKESQNTDMEAILLMSLGSFLLYVFGSWLLFRKEAEGISEDPTVEWDQNSRCFCVNWLCCCRKREAKQRLPVPPPHDEETRDQGVVKEEQIVAGKIVELLSRRKKRKIRKRIIAESGEVRDSDINDAVEILSDQGAAEALVSINSKSTSPSVAKRVSNTSRSTCAKSSKSNNSDYNQIPRMESSDAEIKKPSIIGLVHMVSKAFHLNRHQIAARQEKKRERKTGLSFKMTASRIFSQGSSDGDIEGDKVSNCSTDSNIDKLNKNILWAINSVSFTLKEGECFGLLGPNGAGKSTMFNLLTGNCNLVDGGHGPPTRGEVYIMGKNVFGRVGQAVGINLGIRKFGDQLLYKSKKTLKGMVGMNTKSTILRESYSDSASEGMTSEVEAFGSEGSGRETSNTLNDADTSINRVSESGSSTRGLQFEEKSPISETSTYNRPEEDSLIHQTGSMNNQKFATVASNNKKVDHYFSSAGFCPQHDPLLPEATGKEHIRFYARISGTYYDNWWTRERGAKQPHSSSVTSSNHDENVNAVTSSSDISLQGPLNSHSELQDLVPDFGEDRVDRILRELCLEAAGDKPVWAYSAGMKRRLSLGCALVTEPQILFLDEACSGVDLTNSQVIWKKIRNRPIGQTVVSTTHSMDEATATCARIGILVKGKMTCLGTIMDLKQKFGGGYELSLAVEVFTDNYALPSLAATYSTGTLFAKSYSSGTLGGKSYSNGTLGAKSYSSGTNSSSGGTRKVNRSRPVAPTPPRFQKVIDDPTKTILGHPESNDSSSSSQSFHNIRPVYGLDIDALANEIIQGLNKACCSDSRSNIGGHEFSSSVVTFLQSHQTGPQTVNLDFELHINDSHKDNTGTGDRMSSTSSALAHTSSNNSSNKFSMAGMFRFLTENLENSHSDGKGFRIVDFNLREPTLEDVFLTMAKDEEEY